MRDDLRASLSKCFIRSGVLRMPARIEQHLYGFAAGMLRYQLQQFGGSFGRASIHQQDTVGANYYQDVAARAPDQEEVIGELLDFKRPGLCKCLTRQG